MHKFFVDENQIYLDQNKIEIYNPDLNHIKNVLRLKNGEEIEITSRNNAETYICKISNISDENVTCNILSKNNNVKESDINIHILQGLPKADKMELIIQKCTELGVKELTPINMNRCIVKIDPKEENKKIIRWQKIAESAAKQCGREAIPKINFIHNLKNMYELLKNYDILIVAYENEKNKNLKQVIDELKEKQKQKLNIAILIGPEGGIEQSEIDTLVNAEVVTLGSRILRTETVAFVISSIIMYELRRFRRKQMIKETRIEREIEEKKKLPRELKDQQDKETIRNICVAIFVTLYFMLLNIGYHNIIKNIFVQDTQILSGIMLFLSLILIERAFRKHKGCLAVHGMEFLIIAIITLFVPYIYYINDKYTRLIMVGIIALFDIYFVAKCIIVCIRIKRKYMKELSDVKNIVVKEPNNKDNKEAALEEDIVEVEIPDRPNRFSSWEEDETEIKSLEDRLPEFKNDLEEEDTFISEPIAKPKSVRTGRKTTTTKTKKTSTTKKTTKSTKKAKILEEDIIEEVKPKTRKKVAEVEDVEEVEEPKKTARKTSTTKKSATATKTKTSTATKKSTATKRTTKKAADEEIVEKTKKAAAKKTTTRKTTKKVAKKEDE